jgi:hypothetical protein
MAGMTRCLNLYSSITTITTTTTAAAAIPPAIAGRFDELDRSPGTDLHPASSATSNTTDNPVVDRIVDPETFLHGAEDPTTVTVAPVVVLHAELFEPANSTIVRLSPVCKAGWPATSTAIDPEMSTHPCTVITFPDYLE